MNQQTVATVATLAKHQLWRAGDLSWKLEPTQRLFYEASLKSSSKTFVTEAARRLGKTYGHAIIAIELALKHPGSRINWVQDTAKAVRDGAVPLFEKICREAPPDVRGAFNSQRGAFVFPNGAYIQMFGANTKEDADRARGGDDPIANFLDEAGFATELEYVYVSLLKPAMKRVRRNGHYGMTFLFSSTPYTPVHYFCTAADTNRTKGSYIKLDIYASPDADRYIQEEAEDLGLTVEQFKATSQFKREFMCERIIDTEAVVFPEMHTAKANVVKEWTRPIGFDRFIYRRVSIDPGMSDKTGILFGYVDFTNAKIVVEAEALLSKANTSTIAKEVLRIEDELWPNANPSRVSRVIDDPHGRLVLDLWDMHKIRADKAVKHDREASIGLIRTLLQSGKLVISPRCAQLQVQLLNATKNKSGNDFARDDEGHFDLCAALMYFVRELSISHNPYPLEFDVLTGRSLPEHHPLMARRKAMGKDRPKGLAEAILSGNKYVAGQHKKKSGGKSLLEKYRQNKEQS